MRLIDADALKEAVWEDDRINDLEYATVTMLIEKQPTIGGWIRVKDRLPEMEESVLVFCKAREKHIHSVITITEMSDANPFNYRVKTKPYWRAPWDFFNVNYEITHWMPLPESPKEETA